MTKYAIGDVRGNLQALLSLLDIIQFDRQFVHILSIIAR